MHDTVRGSALASEQETSPGFYRLRAAHMFKQAQTAESEALRKAYQAIAEDWTRLAEQAEKSAETPY
jgi:signal-transduction protein with cAMP-binding, CBS, and nucleotidyltransferase domain